MTGIAPKMSAPITVTHNTIEAFTTSAATLYTEILGTGHPGYTVVGLAFHFDAALTSAVENSFKLQLNKNGVEVWESDDIYTQSAGATWYGAVYPAVGTNNCFDAGDTLTITATSAGTPAKDAGDVSAVFYVYE